MSSWREVTSDRRRATVCVEDLPSLSVADVWASLETAKSTGSSPWRHDDDRAVLTVRATNSGARKTVYIGTTHRGDEVTISYTPDRGTPTQTIKLVRATIGAAERPLFMCPLTGRRVRTLYLVKGLFCSRHAYKIPYATQVDSKLDRLLNRRDAITREIVGGNGRSPATGRRRVRLIEQLRPLGRLFLLDDEHEDLIYQDDPEEDPADLLRALRAEKRRRQSARRHTIEPGYTAAGYISPWAIAGLLDNEFEASLDFSLFGRPWPGLALPRAALDDHLVVDLRVVQRSRLIRPGEMTHWAMAEAPNKGDGRLYLAIDLRRMDLPHLRTRYIGQEGGKRFDTRQVVDLIEPAPDGRNRWLFRDPGGGRPCEVLALRRGLLASRQSQHLVNASQIRGRGRVSRHSRGTRALNRGPNAPM